MGEPKIGSSSAEPSLPKIKGQEGSSDPVSEAALRQLGSSFLQKPGEPHRISRFQLLPEAFPASPQEPLHPELVELTTKILGLKKGVSQGRLSEGQQVHSVANFTGIIEASPNGARSMMQNLIEALADATPQDKEKIQEIVSILEGQSWFREAITQEDVKRMYDGIVTSIGSSPKPSTAEKTSSPQPSTAAIILTPEAVNVFLTAAHFLPSGETTVTGNDGTKYFVQLSREPADDSTVITVSTQLGQSKELVEKIKVDRSGEISFFDSMGERQSPYPPAMADLLLSTLFVDLQTKLEEKKKKIDEGLQKLGVKPEVAVRIAENWASRWSTYVQGKGVRLDEENPKSSILWEQPPKGSSERIPGVKVCSLGGIEGERRAVIALGDLGSGSFKRAKGIVALYPNEELVTGNVVRFTKKLFNTPKEKQTYAASFQEDLQWQVGIEQEIEKAAETLKEEEREKKKYLSQTLLGSSHVIMDEHGKKSVKTRYFADRAEGDLVRFCPRVAKAGDVHMRGEGDTWYKRIVDRWYAQGPDKKWSVPADEQAKKQQAVLFQAVRDVGIGLEYMHECGFCHMDIKQENILLPVGIRQPSEDGVQAKISDFGLTVQKGTLISRTGTPGFIAPEIAVVEKEADPSMDMFSYGVMLLSLYNPELGQKLIEKNDGFLKGTHSVFDMRTLIGEIQSELSNYAASNEIFFSEIPGAGDPERLISELIDMDPEKRPTSSAAVQRLNAVIDNPDHPYWERKV